MTQVAMIVSAKDGRLTKTLSTAQYVEQNATPFVTVMVDGTLYVAVKEEKRDEEAVRMLAGSIASDLKGRHVERATADVKTLALVNGREAVTAFVEGWELGGYEFSKYQQKKGTKTALFIDGADEREVTLGKTRAEAVALSRDLMNEVSDVLNPVGYAEWAVDHFAQTAVDVTVFDRAELERREMNGVLTVGQGSRHEQRFVELRYEGDASKPLVALVGKGVTFDTGGISLKGGDDLSDMRMDMGGSAAVMGAIHLLERTKAPVNVVGLVPMVENAPDNLSVYPGEVITYKNGTSVQVANTDAEGRLILADGLIRAGEWEAEYVVDIATLTGAIHRALGDKIGGVFGEEALAFEMKKVGEASGDFVWPMPMTRAYNDSLKSDYADLKNISTLGFAGATTAALFLEHFVDPKAKWLHVDMAGVMEASKAEGYYAKSATGYGARLLADYTVAVSK